jgi:hypothetical protein
MVLEPIKLRFKHERRWGLTWCFIPEIMGWFTSIASGGCPVACPVLRVNVSPKAYPEMMVYNPNEIP